MCRDTSAPRSPRRPGAIRTPIVRWIRLRLVDTRDTGARVAAGGTLTVDLSVLAPTAVGADAAAVAVNVTAAGPAAAGFLTVWPCGSQQPLASSVNFLAGQARGAEATTLLGPGRTLCVFSNAATDIVVDLQGVFVPTGGLLFSPVTPDRKLDTRNTGRASQHAIQAPPGAAAVAANADCHGRQQRRLPRRLPVFGHDPSGIQCQLAGR